MNKIIMFTIILIVLTSCASPQTPEGLPNPASAYCEQNGNKLEIRTALDGSQSGVCVFSNSSVCDEWAYYRGECGPTVVEATVDSNGGGAGGTNPSSYMPPGTTEAIVDWRGVIKSTEPGAQYDDYFERQDLGQIIYFGIDSMDPVIKAQIEELGDSGKIIHIYGTLVSNVPDFNGSQIIVSRIEIEE